MKFHKSSSYLSDTILIALSVSTLFGHTDVSPVEVRDMILSGELLIILDVREYSEFCGTLSHIENAANLPWNTAVLQSRFAELPIDAKIITVCRSGNRSNQAANFLDAEGFTNVYDMAGGMNAWIYSTESCGVDPVLKMDKTTAGVEANWTPASGAQDYDLIRGSINNLFDSGITIDLGVTECLQGNSPFTYRSDTDPLPSGSTDFYLCRQIGSIWGRSSQNQERVTSSTECD